MVKTSWGLRFCFMWLVLIVLTAQAMARPYSMVARYGDGAAASTANLTVEQGGEVPDVAKGVVLRDFALKFDLKPFGLFPSRAFEFFKAKVAGDGMSCAEANVNLAALENGGEAPVCRWSNAQGAGRDPVRVIIEVRARLTSEMLCAIELQYRDKNGKAPTAAQRPNRDAAFRGGEAPQQVLLFAPNRELFASFCRTTDWGAVVQRSEYSRHAADPNGLERQQRKKLFELIRPAVAGFFASWAEFDPDDPATIVEKFELEVFRSGNMFLAYEYGPNGTEELSTVVDAESVVSFTVKSDPGTCARAQQAPFRYTVGEVGLESSVVTVKPKFRVGCQFDLPLDLKKFIGKKMIVRALFDVDGEVELALYELEFTPHILGFEWTLPVLSELRAAGQGWSKDEFRAQSSLPLSWALSLESDPRFGVAITVPWKISYATRESPDLPKIFSVYPHLSVIVMESDSGATPVSFATGLGLSVVNSFHFSWGVSFSGPHRGDHFLLLGIDIKDLSDVFSPSR